MAEGDLEKVIDSSLQEQADNRAMGIDATKQEKTAEEKEAALIQAIENEMKNSHSEGTSSQFQQDLQQGLNYYFNRPRGDEQKGKSQVQSSDVMDVIEWMIPDIIEAFTTNDDIVQFEPLNANDVDQARLESQYVNWLFQGKSAGYLVIYELVKDALLQKNGITKVYYDKQRSTKYAQYTGVTELELEEILKSTDEVEVEPYKIEEKQIKFADAEPEQQQVYQSLPSVQEQMEQIGKLAQQYTMSNATQAGYGPHTVMTPEIQQQMQMWNQEVWQQNMPLVTVTLYDVGVKVHYNYGCPKVKVCMPERFMVNEDHASLDLNGARFSGEKDYCTPSDLLEMGIDPEVVESLNTISATAVTEGERARQYGQKDITNHSSHQPTKDIERVDCNIRFDWDDDGIAELRHVVLCDKKIVENEYADFVMFSAITPIIIPHRFIGVSMFDRMKQIQDIATTVWRQLLDNTYKMNNARTVVLENQVNMDDLLANRPGGVVRARSKDAVTPFPHTPLGVETYQLLERLSAERMTRSGVGPEVMAEGMVVDNETAHGMERLMSAKEKLVGLIIRNFAETGIKDVFNKLHELAIKHASKEEMFQIAEKWVKVNPQNWKWRNASNTKVGLGAGDRIKSGGTLLKIIELHGGLIQNGKGGILVNDKKTYNAFMDFARYNGLRNPSMYFLDPDSAEAKQTAKAMAEAAAKPSIEEKVLMLTQQLETEKENNKKQKTFMDGMMKKAQMMQDWIMAQDESARDWTRIEIEQEEADTDKTKAASGVSK